jgi:hypothetical protein
MPAAQAIADDRGATPVDHQHIDQAVSAGTSSRRSTTARPPSSPSPLSPSTDMTATLGNQPANALAEIDPVDESAAWGQLRHQNGSSHL